MTTRKPTYQELDNRVRQLEDQLAQCSQVTEEQLIRLKYMESVFHNGPVAIATLDRDHRIVDWNPGAQEIFGYSKDEVLGRDLDDLVSGPEVDREARANTAKVLAGQNLYPFEAVRFSKCGSPIHLLASAVPIFIEGELKGLVAMYADISQRKHAEEDLKRILDATDDGIWDYNLVTGEFRYSDRWAEMLGFSQGEVSNFGCFCDSNTHPEDIERFRRAFADYLEGRAESYALEFRLKTKNGGYKWIYSRGKVVEWSRDGTPVRVVGAHTDITEQKQAEQTLRSNEQLLAKSQEIAHLGSWVLDSDTQHLYWSDEVYRIFGIQPQDFPASYEAFLELVHPEDRAMVHDFFRSSMSKDQENYDLEHRVIRRDTGEIRHVHEKCEHERNAGGRVVRSIGMVHDVTEWRSAQNKLQQAKRQAESANRAKSEFLANMSHEIRTPLNGIMGMLQVLQMTRLDEEQGEYVEMATKASKRLSRLLSDLLDLSKIEAEKMELREEEFLLSEVMESIRDIFSHAIEENDNSLSLHIDERIPLSLVGDSTRLTQVLFNLVGNAAKYTRNGTVDVQTFALSSSSPDTCRILFRVEDTGVGIPDNRFHKIFEAFSQVNTSGDPHSRQYEGAGLGLPLVKRIVDLLGGKMSFASEEGKGTTVYVSLEFQLPESRQWSLQVHESDEDEEIQPLKVLVVDDDEVTRLHMSRLLEKQKLTVRIAENGERALEELARTQFDCVLMDVQMPVLDGVETTKRIRASRTVFQDVPIIALTAYAMSGDRKIFLQAGMDDYIAKPVEGKELIAIIKRNIENITG